jgi:hypothetical protein
MSEYKMTLAVVDEQDGSRKSKATVKATHITEIWCPMCRKQKNASEVMVNAYGARCLECLLIDGDLA